MPAIELAGGVAGFCACMHSGATTSKAAAGNLMLLIIVMDSRMKNLDLRILQHALDSGVEVLLVTHTGVRDLAGLVDYDHERCRRYLVR